MMPYLSGGELGGEVGPHLVTVYEALDSGFGSLAGGVVAGDTAVYVVLIAHDTAESEGDYRKVRGRLLCHTQDTRGYGRSRQPPIFSTFGGYPVAPRFPGYYGGSSRLRYRD